MSEENGIVGVKNIAETLPNHLLIKVFSFLDIKDLFNMQFVSEYWNSAFRENELWKLMNFHIHKWIDMETLQFMLENLPQIQSISTRSQDPIPYQCLDTMLHCMTNISRLNCSFTPPIRLSDVQKIVDKYHRIEAITLDCSTMDVLASLNILKQKAFLKEITFYKDFECKSDGTKNIFKRLYITICDLLLKFPELQKLDIAVMNVVDDEQLRDAFIMVLRQKSPLLVSLVADFYANPNIFTELAACVNLQELTLTLRGINTANLHLNIRTLSKLRTLGLTFRCENVRYDNSGPLKMFLSQTFSSLFTPNTFLHLQHLKISINTHYFDAKGILTKICETFPKLKYLNFKTLHCQSINKELVDIRNMINLETFSLRSESRIYAEAFDFISACLNLRYLKLKSCVKFKSGSYKQRMRRIQNVIAMLSALKSLETFVINKCSFEHISDELRNILINYCKTRGIKLRYKS